MAPLRFHRVLAPAIRLLDRSSGEPNAQPTVDQERTRFPEFPWDLRTLIMLFPQDAPFRFLNLNVTLGLTGTLFDQAKNWAGSAPKEAFDLQFCLESKDTAATYKRYHSISRELSYQTPRGVSFKLGEKLLFEGQWPKYHIQYTQPEDDLTLSMQLDSWPGFHWWVYSPRIYCHYTSFCDCRLEWRWREASGALSVPALHDHGWGKNLLPMRTPLRVFRYEVLRLPESGFALSLWTEGPAGLELKNMGLIRRRTEPPLIMKHYECKVLAWEVFDNYAKQPCRVPKRWIGTQRGENSEFTYEAERSSEPRAIFGEGFLYAFSYKGRQTGARLPSQTVEGSGYAEHLGFTRR
ncbi:MAG: hypothetical protein C4520_07675 [Candidatus Abyssobacteria bacterium SURF_5]|uniref:Uncharacterized protein n=1 Tax=Abyssobacteria bacterium (strain SURF_5) TaxID=2093360 RepID=A0A3A4P4L3_ABYX5|nr:MAG: hypothetical protein C4520_07675 [Candidatus Abyssubacteria bacterium SURF_5]